MKADDTKPRFVLDTKSTAELKYRIKQNPQAGLKEAAQQFEGMLLNMVMKSMRDATPQDGLLNSDQTRFFTSMLDQQLAQNLSTKGSLGFAKLIEQQLGRNLAPAAPLADPSADPSATLAALQQSLIERKIANTNSSALSASAGAERWRSASGASGPADVSPASPVSGPSGANDFVNRLWPHAVDAARSLGVPPQFLVAHAALETGWGKSEIRTAQGAPSYNLFGIKAGKSWAGAAVEAQTTEYVDGVAQSVREKFRVYGSYREAFQDYANLLRSSPRYGPVLGQQDGTQFARSLQQSGYATDPMYADKLGRIINGMTLRQALAG